MLPHKLPHKLPHLVISTACALLVVFSGLSVPPRSSGYHAYISKKTQAVENLASESGFSGLFRRAPSPFGGAVIAKDEESESESESELEGIEDDPDGRGDWFTFQRTYPGNVIPPNARLKAWESMRRFEISSFVPQATPMWHPIGPAPSVSTWSFAWGLTSGRVNSIAVSPVNSQLVIIGSATGGIWRSTDGGETYLPVSDDQVDLAVGSLAFSKSNPSIVYAGMGDTKVGYLGSGVLKSTDEGRTWTRVSNGSLPAPGTIGRLVIDSTNPNRVFVAQYSKVAIDKVTSSGVFLSVDGGVNWSRKLAGAARDVLIDPNNPHSIYAGLSRIEKDTDPLFGLYKSTDDGVTWSNRLFTAEYDLIKRRDIRVAMTAGNPGSLYSYFGGFIGDNADVHLRVSTDAGATWAERSLAGVDTAQLGYNTYLLTDPSDPLTIYLGSRDVYRTADGAASWTNLTHNFYDNGAGFQYSPGGANSHADQHALALSPSPNEIFIGNDGGVSKSVDGGANFHSVNSTLSLTQFIGIARHPTNPAISYGGTQDNGTQKRSADSVSWSEIVTGDGGHCVIDPLDPSIVFATYVRGDVYRFLNDGQTFDGQIGSDGSFGESFDNPRIAFYPPFVSNGVDGSLYFGTWRLFVSTNLGNSWFAPAGFLDLTKGETVKGKDVLAAIAVARSNTSVIYTGSSQGRAMVSRNGGSSWSDVTRGLPDRSITGITVDPSRAAVAYLTVSGFGAGHVFKTTDTGASWTDISGSLPDVPANVVLIDQADANTVYLGTDIGVFRSTTQGADWRSFNRGLPPVVVHDFSTDKSGVIQVATYGRGAYELGTASATVPSITSVAYDGNKKLSIEGTGFGDEAMVVINGEDRSFKIVMSSDTAILLKAKPKKLGLVTGVNTIQVVTSGNVSSNVFTITIE